jgi:acyl transferase domain-containing protein
LPNYPFERRRCWLPEKKIRFEPVVPHAGGESRDARDDEQPSSDKREIDAFDVLIGDDPIPAQHFLKGEAVVPAASMMDWILSAGMIGADSDRVALRDLEFSRVLPFRGGAQNVLVTFQPKEDGLRIGIADQDDRKTVAVGRVCDGDASAEAETINVSEIEARCATLLTDRDCYKLLSATELDYGPALHVIQDLSCNADEALVRLKLPKEAGRGRRYKLHPAILDGAFQSVAAFLAHTSPDKGVEYVPFTLDEVALFGPLPDECLCHIRKVRGAAGEPVVETDLSLTDLKGRVVLKAKRFTVHARGESAEHTLGLFRLGWEAAPLRSSSAKEAAGGEAGRVVSLARGDRFADLGGGTYSLNPGEPSDYEMLLDALADKPERSVRIAMLPGLWRACFGWRVGGNPTAGSPVAGHPGTQGARPVFDCPPLHARRGALESGCSRRHGAGSKPEAGGARPGCAHRGCRTGGR